MKIPQKMIIQIFKKSTKVNKKNNIKKKMNKRL